MKKVKTLLIASAITLSLSVPLLANKRLYKATLGPGCSGSRALGNSFLRQTLPSSAGTYLEFVMFGRRLGGEANAVTIRRSTGPESITICSQSSSSVLGTCPAREFNTILNALVLDFTAQITPAVLLQFGINGSQFQQWADDGELYVTVGTSLCSVDAIGTYLRIDNN